MGVLPALDHPIGPRQQLTPTPTPGPILTQTITRSSTTFTTYVTLGGPAPEAFQSAAYQTPPPTPSPFPTIVTDAQPEPEHVLTSGEIGAILGSIFAFVILCLVVWACMVPRWRRRGGGDDDDDDDRIPDVRTNPHIPHMFRHRRMSSGSTDFGTVYVARTPWTRYQQARVLRAAPEAHNVRVHPKPVPVFSNVRRTNVPPPGYFTNRG